MCGNGDDDVWKDEEEAGRDCGWLLPVLPETDALAAAVDEVGEAVTVAVGEEQLLLLLLLDDDWTGV